MIEQSKPLLYLVVGLASIFIIIFGIRLSADILNPILLAIVITIAVSPLPAKLTARGMPGWLSLVLTFILVLGVIGLVLLMITFTAGRLVQEIPSLQQEFAEQQGALEASSDQPFLFPWLSTGAIVDGIESFMLSQRTADVVTTLLGSLVKGVSQAFIVLLIFAFMLASTLAMPSADRLGLNPDQPLVNRFVQLTAEVRQYVNLTAFINLLVAIGNTILLLILGVEPALLWGLLSWFMGFIPAIGFWIAMIPPLLIALVSGEYVTAAIVFLGYVLINGSVENFVKPRMFGQNLSISPVVVAVSLIVWGWLLGAVGAILAIPMMLMILTVLELFDGSRWLATLMRTTGNRESGERQDAIGQLKETWSKVRNAVLPPDPPPPTG
ncbi:MAG: AI-2E family transporter [Chloroflexota bacterium]